MTDWVLCLEVAEHIPRGAGEAAFLRNLNATNRKGIVLSWSNNEGGNGHVNLRSNEWVVETFRSMGYEHDVAAEVALRKSVTTIPWFRETIIAFRRRDAALDGQHGTLL